MATAPQTFANSANGQTSTGSPHIPSPKGGPRTDAGKASSSQNATRHGLSSTRFIILPGQEEEFAQFSEALRAEFRPDGPYQDILFRQILHAAWNQERCRKAEAALYAASPDHDFDPLLAATNEPQLKLIALYLSRAERSFSQAAKELRRAQTEALYRAEAGITSTFSPLAESNVVDRQIAIDNLRRKQALLTEVRAVCQTPMPEPPPPSAAGAPMPAPAPESSQPQPRPDNPAPQDTAHPELNQHRSDAVRGGFSRHVIFKRKKNKVA